MEKSDSWKLRNNRFNTFHFSRDIMRELAQLRSDNITGALYIIKDYLVILSCVFVTLNISEWFYPISVLIIGAHQRGLTTISHDAAHRILAKNTWWNHFLGATFAAYPIFQRHWAYRVSHVHLHHPHLGNPEKDPDLQFFIASGVYEVRKPGEYKLSIVWKAIFGGATLRYLKYLWHNRFLISNKQDKGVNKHGAVIDTYGFAAFWVIVIAGFVITDNVHLLLIFWLIPYLTTFQILGWFTEIAEHSPMCETENQNIYLTRNRKGNLMERVLFGVNFDEYHLEHHLSPGVPFWLLKRAQDIRMRDPEYAELANSWGGLFVSGPNGQPSVISQLLDRNKRLYEAQHASPDTPEQAVMMNEYFDETRAVVGVAANRHLHDGVHRDWLRRRYIEALERYASVECVIIPTIDGNLSREETLRKFRDVMRRLDGLVLTGDESNLDPNIFNKQLAWYCTADDVVPGERDRPRDRLSSVALSVAIELDMPILGICRGLQEMSVHSGGKLHLDLSVLSQSVSHSEPPDVPRDQQYLPTHTISVMPVGRLSPIVESSELYVNSLHNQGITTVGAGVQIEAVASDGVIEALSYKTSSTFQLAVQWHPEWHAATDVTSQKVFKAFGSACLVYQSTRPPPRRPAE